MARSSLASLTILDRLTTLGARALAPIGQGAQHLDRGTPMYEPATPNREPVDSRYAAASPDWRGHVPADARPGDYERRVAAAWFQPLWEQHGQEADVVGWRFTCPFCNAERKHQHYSETYASAYRHLLVCEWTDRMGLGPGGS